MISKFQKTKCRLKVTWEPECPKSNALSDKKCQHLEPMTVISTALEQPPKPGFPRTHGVVKPLESTVLVCSYRASIKQDLETTGPDTGSQGPLLQDNCYAGARNPIFSSACTVRLWCGTEAANIRTLLDDLARDTGVHLQSTWTTNTTQNTSLTDQCDKIGSCCGTGLGMKPLMCPGWEAVAPEPSTRAPRLAAVESSICGVILFLSPHANLWACKAPSGAGQGSHHTGSIHNTHTQPRELSQCIMSSIHTYIRDIISSLLKTTG